MAYWDDDNYYEEELIDGVGFADPVGIAHSALPPRTIQEICRVQRAKCQIASRHWIAGEDTNAIHARIAQTGIDGY